MLLSEAIQIIDFTDSDQFQDAIEQFNNQGIITSDDLPFMDSIYQLASSHLLKRLVQSGCSEAIEIVGLENQGDDKKYFLYDKSRLSLDDVVGWMQQGR